MSGGEKLRRLVNVNGDRNRRMTDAMRAVLAVIVDAAAAEPAWGLSICETTRLGPAPAVSR